MGKRPRPPHFISGIGDGKVNVADKNSANSKSKNARQPNDDIFVLGANNAGNGGGADGANSGADRYFIRSRNERLARMEDPLLSTDQWRDVFSGDPALGKPSQTISGPWQVSAFALLGIVVIMSAIFLHMISDSHSEDGSPYGTYRRRQRQARRQYKTRKKKTDEWSDDEEESIVHNGAWSSEQASGWGASPDEFQTYPHYYNLNAHETIDNSATAGFAAQEHRLRRTSYKDHEASPRASGGRSKYYMPVNATYRSPSAKMMSGMHRRGISPGNSFNSNTSGGRSPGPNVRGTASIAGGNLSSGSHGRSAGSLMRATAPISGRLRVPPPPEAHELFPPGSTGQNSASGNQHLMYLQQVLPTAPEESQLSGNGELLGENQFHATSGNNTLGARPLNSSNFSSFASIEGHDSAYGQITSPPHSMPRNERNSSEDSLEIEALIPPVSSSAATSSHASYHTHNSNHLEHASYHSHHQSLLLSPGNYEATTPQIGNARRALKSGGNSFGTPHWPPKLDTGEVPFMPSLDASKHSKHSRDAEVSPIVYAASRPPRSVLMDELRLVQMETGNSTHWAVREASERHDDLDVEESFHEDAEEPQLHGGTIARFDYESSDEGSDISIPSGDPRKSIIHKRSNLTMSTDAYSSLQSSIDFDELDLQEVIGGGGFGQVWRASWRGTPVAVKLLTGSAQNTHIAKAILEEFKAEINLLKGMRHPNICLYMGASLRPPNRAIVTELAANGSVWDALRLPLSAPYAPADGTIRGAWPSSLYTPDQHGAPPSNSPRLSTPIPPKGSWPWELVKRVACGAARGMAYLHSGNPPVLHRDLKSANLLLDESYTAKVCDFGLSRLKAQSRSMTGNCGTVQWMAPEVLSNMSYDEKADVFSYGIILWELLSRECPYEGMTAIQCALAVLNRDKRPEIPKWCPPALHALIKSCIKKNPDLRPSFSQILMALDAIDN